MFNKKLEKQINNESDKLGSRLDLHSYYYNKLIDLNNKWLIMSLLCTILAFLAGTLYSTC